MENNNIVKLANIKMLEFVATKLGELCNEFVFLGGCTTGLFITDSAVPDIRYTLDVDCIVEVASLHQYQKIEKELIKKRFKKSITEEVICRWFYDDVILDVMPTDEKILGFGNCWYKEAIAESIIYSLSKHLEIRTITAPYFLATKFEAFKTRGNNDFYASHDFEDIVSVLDGRTEIAKEIRIANKKLKEYLVQSLHTIKNNLSFKGALPGHFVQYGNLADDRIELFEETLNIITME